jgi:hypothetical protein
MLFNEPKKFGSPTTRDSEAQARRGSMERQPAKEREVDRMMTKSRWRVPSPSPSVTYSNSATSLCPRGAMKLYYETSSLCLVFALQNNILCALPYMWNILSLFIMPAMACRVVLLQWVMLFSGIQTLATGSAGTLARTKRTVTWKCASNDRRLSVQKNRSLQSICIRL